jgi:hypothetical protein
MKSLNTEYKIQNNVEIKISKDGIFEGNQKNAVIDPANVAL